MPQFTTRFARAVAVAAVLGALGAGAAACSSPGSSAVATTTSSAPTAATTTTTAAVPTTTSPPAVTTPPPVIPTGLQTSASDAASALVSAWAEGSRGKALSVATSQAVASLFASPYPGGDLAIPRGCSDAFPPLVCTYGPPGGGPSNAPIYQIYASQVTGGWYVSSVEVEG